MRTNEERADKADRLVSNYETDSSLEECLSDLLGDLRHFSDKYGLNFAERDEVGYRNYVHEMGVEGGPVAAEVVAKRSLEERGIIQSGPAAGDTGTSDGLGT